jgi:glutathione peroxidase
VLNSTLSYVAFIVVALLLSTQTINAQEMKEGEMTGDMDYRDFPFQTITGDTTNLRAFAGDVVLIVNTASKCGFTPQYEGLEAMYEKYKDRGFTILGFPANDFMNQEPGTDKQIAEFCKSEFGVSFTMMSKVHVKGDEQIPLYKYLTEKSPFPGKITWNFNKFLVDRSGVVIGRFDSKNEPLGDKIPRAVEEALGR